MPYCSLLSFAGEAPHHVTINAWLKQETKSDPYPGRVHVVNTATSEPRKVDKVWCGLDFTIIQTRKHVPESRRQRRRRCVAVCVAVWLCGCAYQPCACCVRSRSTQQSRTTVTRLAGDDGDASTVHTVRVVLHNLPSCTADVGRWVTAYHRVQARVTSSCSY